LNFLEAIKSGKPSRRKFWPKEEFININQDYITFHITDLLADDWEIDEPKITITRSQLAEAWNANFIRKAGENPCFEELCKRLGL